MPTYEYRCRACDHTFEIVQKMRDDPLTICPECGGELRKVFAPPVITFKGSGFYATDHGKKTNTSGEGKGAEGKGAEGKGDTPTGTTEEPAGKKTSDTSKSAETAASSSKETT